MRSLRLRRSAALAATSRLRYPTETVCAGRPPYERTSLFYNISEMPLVTPVFFPLSVGEQGSASQTHCILWASRLELARDSPQPLVSV